MQHKEEQIKLKLIMNLINDDLLNFLFTFNLCFISFHNCSFSTAKMERYPVKHIY